MAYFSAPKLENHPLFIIKNHAITILFLFWFKIANEHREFRNYLTLITINFYTYPRWRVWNLGLQLRSSQKSQQLFFGGTAY